MTITFDIWKSVMAADLSFWEMADGQTTNFRSLFTDTAVIDIGTVKINGIADIEAFVENRRQEQPGLLSRHICSNHRLNWMSASVIDGTGIVAVHAGEGPPPIQNTRPYLISDVSGRYERVDGVWKIASRRITPVFSL